MSLLSSFKVFISPMLDKNASTKAAKDLGNQVKSEVTESTRNISLEIQTSIRKMGGAVSRGQVAGQALFAFLNRIIAKFDEMKSSVHEASASLGGMNDAAADLDSTVERVARHNLTLADSGLSGNQQQAYTNFLLQVQRIMDSGSIGSGDNERSITFASDDVINNAIEVRKLLDAGLISLDDLGVAGKQQARLANTFKALSTDDYQQKFNSNKYNAVNGLNTANEINYGLQDQHTVDMILAEAQRQMQITGGNSFSMVAKTLESERQSYQRITQELNPASYGKALESQQNMEEIFSLLDNTFNNLAVEVLPPLTTALELLINLLGGQKSTATNPFTGQELELKRGALGLTDIQGNGNVGIERREMAKRLGVNDADLNRIINTYGYGKRGDATHGQFIDAMNDQAVIDALMEFLQRKEAGEKPRDLVREVTDSTHVR